MPSVPQYRRQVQEAAIPVPRAQAQLADTQGLERGLSQAGRAASQIMEEQQQRADTASLLEADNKLTEWQNNTFYNQENGVYTRKGKNALDVTNQTLDQFDKYQQEVGSALTNDRQRARFNQIVQSRKGSMSQDLNRYEYGQHQQYMNDTDTASIKLSQDSAALNFSDPNKVGYFRQKAMDVVASQAERNGWSPEETQLQQLSASSKLLTGVIGRQAEQDPNGAKQYLNASRDGMTADDQLRVGNAIQQEERRREAEARQRAVEARQMQAISRMELRGRVEDASAAYTQGLDFKNPPSLADFKAAYGDKAAEEYDSFKKVQDVAPAIRELATATPEERQQLLQKYQPGKDGVAGEGFKEDSQIYQHLAGIGASLVKQQQADPAAYVAKYSPVVQNAFAQAQQEGTPEAYQRYATATVAEQKRLGVQQVKILPDAAAEQLAATFHQKIAEGGSDNAASLIEGWQASWGKNFPTIIQQMGNKLPAEAQVIATGLPKDVAERMASVAPLKDAELNAGLQKGQKDEIGQAVQEAMTPFAESLQGQSGGINTYSTMYKAAQRTATSYVLQGESPKDAAKRVVGGMVNDKYDFFGTYRVPKTQDTEAVSRGASEAMRSIKPDELMPLPGVSGVTEEQNRKQLHDALQSSGQWVPNEDESGLSLTLNGYRVRGVDGKPITKSWADLQQKGTREPDQYRVAPMGFMP